MNGQIERKITRQTDRRMESKRSSEKIRQHNFLKLSRSQDSRYFIVEKILLITTEDYHEARPVKRVNSDVVFPSFQTTEEGYFGFKRLLGVHSKATNFAVKGELGCYPINTCLYTRLLNIENSLKECNILLEARKTSWLSTISHLLQLIDLNLNQIFQSCRLDPKQIVHKVENKLKELYEERFWSEISKSSRLCYLYRLLKKEYKMEQYVEDIFYYKYRSSVARLRISAHFFRIET